jgi:2-polyprenyl-3-methyl-5-hydroxy-6-metoxy-1,4-benzoquinol methylase
MTRQRDSIPDSYFEALYAQEADPWGFSTSDYEFDKYTATLNALGTRRITRALEVGCSIGVFTQALAPHCDRVLAIDVAERALIRARTRCQDFKGVEFRKMRVPAAWPEGDFDLIILSEVLYYLTPTDIERIARQSVASLSPLGRIMLVHWTGETDYPCTADDAAAVFLSATAHALGITRQERHPSYRLDLLQRRA